MVAALKNARRWVTPRRRRPLDGHERVSRSEGGGRSLRPAASGRRGI